jgi:hypothetical protein
MDWRGYITQSHLNKRQSLTIWIHMETRHSDRMAESTSASTARRHQDIIGIKDHCLWLLCDHTWHFSWGSPEDKGRTHMTEESTHKEPTARLRIYPEPDTGTTVHRYSGRIMDVCMQCHALGKDAFPMTVRIQSINTKPKQLAPGRENQAICRYYSLPTDHW